MNIHYYVDASSRFKSLKSELESLQKMMAYIDSTVLYDFWYTLQKRISETEQEIAVLEHKIQNFDGRVSYSTVSLELYEAAEFTEDDKNFGESITNAFTRNRTVFGEFCKGIALFIASVLPFIILTGVICVIVIIALKITGKKK